MGKSTRNYLGSYCKKAGRRGHSRRIAALEDLLRGKPGAALSRTDHRRPLVKHISPVDKKQAEEAFSRHLDRIDTSILIIPPR